MKKLSEFGKLHYQKSLNSATKNWEILVSLKQLTILLMFLLVVFLLISLHKLTLTFNYHFIATLLLSVPCAFSALTLLVRRQEGHLACKKFCCKTLWNGNGS